MTVTFLVAAAAIAAAAISARLITWATRRALVAMPNQRSLHTEPTPTGAGLAIAAVTLAGITIAHVTFGARLDLALGTALLMAGLMAIVGWLDDHHSLSALVRLALQMAGAAVVLAAAGPVSQILVPGAGHVSLGLAGAVIALVWLVGLTNAYNFMDGIDGLAGAQGVVAGVAWGIAGTINEQPAVATAGWLAAGACLGFLRYNWRPASIFMGDVGALFLGFLFGALTLVASRGAPAIPLFGLCVVWPFVFDSTFTLLRRAMRGENLLQAHQKHLYQRLVIAGWSHQQVAWLYAAGSVSSSAAGLALVAGAVSAGPLLALILPGVAVGLWGLTVSEEWRSERALELNPHLGAAAFNHFSRNRYILAVDVVLVVFSAFAAFAMRFDGVFVLHRREFPLFLALAVFTKPIVFLTFGLYKRYWRYASVWDLVAVVLAVSAAEVVLGSAILGTVLVQRQIFDYIIEFSRSVILIDWLVTLILIGGVRMAVRLFSESTPSRERRASVPGSPAVKRVLIVGAGDAGVIVLREINRNRALNMEVAGFLDDDPAKRGKRIHAALVLGPLSALVAITESHNVTEAIIALPTASGTIVRRVIEACREAGITFTSVPGVFELLDGQLTVSRLRSVDIGDLLRRTQIPGFPDAAGYLGGQTVLVTGAGGSIGSELCHQIARSNPARLVLLGHGENSIFAVQHEMRERAPGLPVQTVIADVRDAERLRQVFRAVRPTAVFHAAAHKHVPLMEENPEEAVTNNVFGTRNVVQAALDAGVERLVLISTDKAVQPSSVMGATKRLAELIVTDAAKRHGRAFVVVRFGNVLGSRGSVVPTFKRQIELGQPIQITHPDMTRFFMTIPEAVHLVLQAGGLGRGGELFVLNMGQPVAIVDLAKDLIRLSGYDVDDIPIVFTGLRPGEKLEERLWEEGALVQPTENPDVLRVAEQLPEHADVAEILAFLKSAVETGDRASLLFALTTSVPSFTSTTDGRPATL